jgi:hypothetical protein
MLVGTSNIQRPTSNKNRTFGGWAAVPASPKIVAARQHRPTDDGFGILNNAKRFEFNLFVVAFLVCFVCFVVKIVP